MTSYEVWCHPCNVTFPPEQKNCLHCGARLQPERPVGRRRRGAPRVPELVLTPSGFQEVPATPAAPTSPVAPAGPAAATVVDMTGPPLGETDDEEEQEPVRRSLLRAGMTVIWMVLLAAGYAWRACSQN